MKRVYVSVDDRFSVFLCMWSETAHHLRRLNISYNGGSASGAEMQSLCLWGPYIVPSLQGALGSGTLRTSQVSRLPCLRTERVWWSGADWGGFIKDITTLISFCLLIKASLNPPLAELCISVISEGNLAWGEEILQWIPPECQEEVSAESAPLKLGRPSSCIINIFDIAVLFNLVKSHLIQGASLRFVKRRCHQGGQFSTH